MIGFTTMKKKEGGDLNVTLDIKEIIKGRKSPEPRARARARGTSDFDYGKKKKRKSSVQPQPVTQIGNCLDTDTRQKTQDTRIKSSFYYYYYY